MLYMAYCFYWLSIPTKAGLRDNWLNLIPALLPLLLFGGLAVYENHDALTLAATWGASATLGSLAGFRAGQRAGTRSPALSLALGPPSGSTRRRSLLLAGAALLAAVAVLVAFAVIPALQVERSYATGFRARGVAYFFGGAAGGSLLLSVLLARAAGQDPANSGQTIAVTAIGSLLLGLFWSFASGIRSQHPDLLLASRVLVTCAAGSLLTAGLLTVTTSRPRFADSPSELGARQPARPESP